MVENPAWQQLLLQVELHVQNGGVGVGVQGHVRFLLVVAEEEGVLDDVEVEAFFDQVAFALLEGPRDLQSVLWRWMMSSETGGDGQSYQHGVTGTVVGKGDLPSVIRIEGTHMMSLAQGDHPLAQGGHRCDEEGGTSMPSS